jgi:threonine dehydrogenase-like Zn-dependent dehydrogenase
MRTVGLPGNRVVPVADQDTPRPGPGQVLVRPRTSAICRRDVSFCLGDPIMGEGPAGTGSVSPDREPSGTWLRSAQAPATDARRSAQVAIACAARGGSAPAVTPAVTSG